VFICSIFPGIAQTPNYLNPSTSFYANKMIFGSTLVMPSEYPDSVDIYLLYRLQLNHFLFTNIGNQYVAKYSIELSLADSFGVVKFSKVIIDSIKLQNPITQNDAIQFRTNFIALRTQKANYTAQIRVIDYYTKNSDKSSFALNFSNLRNQPNAFNNIVFLENKGEYSSPIILNNNLRFSSDQIELALFVFNHTSEKSYYEIIKKYNNEKAIDPWGTFEKHSGQLNLTPFSRPLVKLINNSIQITFPNEASLAGPSPENGANIANIIYRDNIFSPGDYVLKIYNNRGDTSQYNFKVYWEDQPLSLLNIPYAVSVSKIFFNEKEMEKIEKGDLSEQFRNLIDAWKQFDTTPNTPFNEAMAEFYNRVDYAYKNYSTFSEKNGANTDKGKIYILFGKPDKIDQKFKNGKLFETWVYSTLIKEFTFETIESGIFKIVEIKE
jgi:GWxTD domain-containing protein